MNLVAATTVGLVLWIVLWALGTKGFDAFMLTTVIILLGAAAQMLKPKAASGRSA